MIYLTEDQQRAMTGILDWFASRRTPVFRLHGFAGTGKTFLMGEVTKALKASNADLRIGYVAPTAKAAEVLTEKVKDDALTLHKMIYHGGPETVTCMRDESTEVGSRKYWRLRQRESNPEAFGPWRYELLICDEASMVDQTLARDLMLSGTPIIACGDPFQLPPVNGPSVWMDDEPDALLSEIKRVENGSPIIPLSMRLREMRPLEFGSNDGLSDIRRCENFSLPTREMLARAVEADQLLCWSNATRDVWNKRMRATMGFHSRVPMPGEKIVCLRNDDGVKNGQSFLVLSSSHTSEIKDLTSPAFRMTLTLRRFHKPEAEPFEVEIDGDQFEWSPVEGARFSYGYGMAITVHKSQGSEWRDVVVLDEMGRSAPDDDFAWRWAYTAVTRAKERLTVFSPGSTIVRAAGACLTTARVG